MREAELAALLPLAEQTVRTAENLDVVGHVAADVWFTSPRSASGATTRSPRRSARMTR
ncbi:hypothetical protein ACFYXF_04440 [Streptomyces sp. NPDC002680]|uniref:hypothetical protein n=1 Tax=Streptomyces sp. NPDC002680 TaxID=3364659 RepID=UPI00367EB8B1